MMMTNSLFVAFLACCAAIGLAASASGSVESESWIETVLTNIPSKPQDAGQHVISKLMQLALDHQAKNVGGSASEYPYFNFLPQYKASPVAGADAVQWSGACMSSYSATSKSTTSSSVELTVTVTGEPASQGCYDMYTLMTVTGSRTIKVSEAGIYTYLWSLPDGASSAEKWDLDNKGVRFFQYVTDEPTSIANALETVLLFLPEFTKPVGPSSAERNVDFMARYPQFPMEKRDPLSSLPPMEHEVHSGDFFGVIRLDGLDPMLAWAMGSTTGHTTVALWMDGELYVTESTVTDSYWPTNGIQKTPYRQWLKQAEEASYNVIWAPLSKENRAKFNETAAVQFFKENEGLDYGYRNLLYGWLDTLYDNYPCVAPDYSSVCVQWELFECLFGIIDRKNPDLADLFVNQAFNLRLGTSGLNTAELYQEAAKQGIETRAVPAMVEQDSWVYNTTRDGEPATGKSMVCCVFVCNIWKAGGLFNDDEVNCAELTNVDDYSLAIFSDEYRQIIGRWTLNLNRFNTKEPYAHMAETCASLAPNYEEAADC